MKSYALFWKRAFNMKGVTSRSQYWIAMLANVIVIAILMIGFSALETMMYERHAWDMAHFMERLSPALIGVYLLAIAVPIITMTVRRLHDQNTSGKFFLLNFIPVVGNIMVLISLCLGTVKSDNIWRMNDIQRGLLTEAEEDPLGDWQYEDYVYHMEYTEEHPEEDV